MSNPWDNDNTPSTPSSHQVNENQPKKKSGGAIGSILFFFLILILIGKIFGGDNSSSSTTNTSTSVNQPRTGKYAHAQMNDDLRQELEERTSDSSLTPVDHDAVIDDSIDSMQIEKLSNIVREQGHRCKSISTASPDSSNQYAFHFSCDHHKHKYYMEDLDQGTTLAGNWAVRKD